ncbi:outer membrane beta-barrel protein [Hymenobacter sp. BRD67]|uniref:outer membrane beta-barrel protein n=1 Tax=Hymenobacter sp. BRD67 TaxID=2675877 RepID=UPI00156696C3|nr:outer membrane beta-barrel protein [Hymenobacter sp. BRD67]QKG54445.1 outer membrane beta-barrel protein [Hymenobacter sp. BRD67]
MLRNNDESKLYNSSNQGFVINARAFGSYDLGNSYSLQLFGFYRGQQVQLQGYQSGFGIYSLSLQKSFAEKRGSIGFGAENFFTGQIRINTNVSTPYVDSYEYNGTNVPINGPVLTQNSTNVIHNLNFKINFSYRIGKLTAGDTGRRGKGVNNDDLKEGGDTGGGLGGDLGGAGGGGAGGAGGQGSGRPGGQGAAAPVLIRAQGSGPAAGVVRPALPTPRAALFRPTRSSSCATRRPTRRALPAARLPPRPALQLRPALACPLPSSPPTARP